MFEPIRLFLPYLLWILILFFPVTSWRWNIFLYGIFFVSFVLFRRQIRYSVTKRLYVPVHLNSLLVLWLVLFFIEKHGYLYAVWIMCNVTCSLHYCHIWDFILHNDQPSCLETYLIDIYLEQTLKINCNLHEDLTEITLEFLGKQNEIKHSYCMGCFLRKNFLKKIKQKHISCVKYHISELAARVLSIFFSVKYDYFFGSKNRTSSK